MDDTGVDMRTCDALCFVPKKYFQHQKWYLIFVLSELGLIFKVRFLSVEAECSDLTKHWKWYKLKYITTTMGSWDR